MTLPRTKQALRGRRTEIENELDKFAVDYTYHVEEPVDSFDVDRSLANQARFEAIDEPTVQLYQEGVERGDAFPAVVAYRPGRKADGKLVIIDGNHRLVAHHRAGKPIDVYEIDRNTKQQTVALMTFAFNTKHGRPTSSAERIEHAKFLIDNGASQEDAAAAVNVPMRDLRRALARAKGDQRADEVGADRREWDALPMSARQRLLNISTDEGFLGAIHLAYSARLNADEIFDLVTLLNTSKSGTKQRALIKSETERYAERIQEVAGGVLSADGSARRSMTPRSRLAMVLGHVVSLPDDAGSLARAFADGEREEAAQRVMEASDRLRKLALAIDSSLA